MKLNYSRNAKDPTYTIASTVRKGNRVSTVVVATIGKHSELLRITSDPLAYAKQKVKEYNDQLKNKVVMCTAEVDLNKKVEGSENKASKSVCVNIGYLFLQKIYRQLNLDAFFKEAVKNKKIDFDCDEISRFLTYARILDPKSKLGTYDDLETYFEKPQFEYHQILRFMDILVDNYSEYLKHIYLSSNNVVKRDTTVCYYDCTNYYYESEQYDEDVLDEVTGEHITGLRQFGFSKQHQPNPLVEMGLIMDKDGIPITMCIHPGNTNEQITAIPLEKELMRITESSKFIYCADAGLGSYNIRVFNSMGGRAFIVTQSIKKLSAELKQAVFNDFDYRLLSDNRKMSVKEMKEFDRKDKKNRALYNDMVYKVIRADKAVDLGLYEYRTLKNGKVKKVKAAGNLAQTVIITFSRKMMEYQRTGRARQVERARKLAELKDPEEIKKGPNDIQCQ